MKELRSIGEVPVRAAEIWGRRTALIFNNHRFSYDDLRRSVMALAAKLTETGLERGQRVAVLMDNRPEYLIAYFAVPAAGGTLVPLNTFLAQAELHDLFVDCGAAILITADASLRKAAPALRGLRDLREIIVCGEFGADPPPVPLHMNVSGFSISMAPDESRLPNSSPPTHPPGEEDVAVIVYTSGTTGTPKGVMLTHRNLLSNSEACIEAVGVTERDRILLFLPMFHSFTEMVGLLAPMMAGMSMVLCERVDRAEIRKAILRHRPTIVPAVPAVFTAMSQARVGALARWFNPVRLYISGGAPLSLETLQKFEELYRRPLCEGYGLSEASPVVAINPPVGVRKPGSIGLPLPGLRIRLLDTEGRAVEKGGTGELLVRGPNVMKGYFRRPEETARVLADGWLHTGDLVRMDEDGYLFVMGRSKDMLICRGMNVYPREIEDVLEGHPLVKEAAVVGVPDASRGEVPFAFIVGLPGQIIDEAELRRVCLARLARYKLPRVFKVVKELPRNPAGKVMKEALKAEALLSLPAERGSGGRADRARQAGM
ncbi:MAG TPA: long-chain-fatty-acid--CoA ligase [Patescibacteria group bacterium]|nr:long-chain-fatty-acid--CoA ligase [Patescibacteria group bacterium]